MEAIPGRVRSNLSPSVEYQFWSRYTFILNEQCPAIIHKRLANNWESSLGSFYGWDMAVKYGDEFHSWIVGGGLLKSEGRRPFISQDYGVDSSQSQDRKVNLILWQIQVREKMTRECSGNPNWSTAVQKISRIGKIQFLRLSPTYRVGGPGVQSRSTQP